MWAGPNECYNPQDARCTQCPDIELKIGACPALADNEFDRVIGHLTAWGMYLCYLIPVVAVGLRRTTWLYWSLAPLLASGVAGYLQSTLISIRPAGCCMAGEQSCGMPSGHCTTAYATLVFALLICHRQGLDGVPWWKLMVGAVFLTIQLLMAYGRVAIYYHTVDQVVWGIVAGAAVALVWFVLVLVGIGPRLGPWLERKLACIGLKDDWNDQVGKEADEDFEGLP
ncbi:hypothetical protein BASA81_002796 [Batrachochytrium salamandrivorans]|nr:hypothetical protein BASA81_002796 [Batrachochytrium salamandrivorans]